MPGKHGVEAQNRHNSGKPEEIFCKVYDVDQLFLNLYVKRWFSS
jgi:hypothetical protein